MKFKRQKIKIHGREKLIIEANVNGVWAYHKSLNLKDMYAITHIPTSLAVYNCLSVRECRDLIEKLSTIPMQGNRFNFTSTVKFVATKKTMKSPVEKWAVKFIKPILIEHRENYWKEKSKTATRTRK